MVVLSYPPGRCFGHVLGFDDVAVDLVSVDVFDSYSIFRHSEIPPILVM